MLPFLLLPFQMLLLTHQGWQVTSQHAGDSPLASESCSMHGARWSGYVWESLKKKTQNSSKFGYFEIVYLGLTIISYPSLGSARGVVEI
jgi:hypothetical protein